MDRDTALTRLNRATDDIAEVMQALRDESTQPTAPVALSSSALPVDFVALAVELGTAVKFNYLKPGIMEDPTARYVVPTTVEGGYFVGWDSSADDWRTFRYDRMSGVSLTRDNRPRSAFDAL